MGNHEHSTRRKSKAPLVIAIVLLVLLCLGGAGFLTVRHYEKKYRDLVEVETFYDGVVVQGVNLGGKTKEQAKAELTPVESTLRGSIMVTLTSGEHSYILTEDNLTYTYNTDEVLETAYQTARTGSLKDRYEKVVNLAQAPAEYPIACTLKEESVKAFVTKIAAEMNTAAVEPVATGFNPNATPKFGVNEGKDGLTVDEAATFAGLLNMIKTTPTGSMEIVVTPIPRTKTPEQVLSETQLISTFSTVSTNGAEGNANMAIALASFNGTTVNPGESFSFNTSTGDSTTSAGGWQQAGAILQGRTVSEYGGGICQASTTLYGAVMRADLEVTERSCHRWPSSYVPIGQDASVDYGNLDFCFKNNKDTPVFLAGWMEGTTLKVEIYGKRPAEWDTIDVVSEQTSTIPAEGTAVIEDSNLPTGTEQFDGTSRAGSEAIGSKIFYKDGVQVKTESIHSSYYAPVQATRRVGIG